MQIITLKSDTLLILCELSMSPCFDGTETRFLAYDLTVHRPQNSLFSSWISHFLAISQYVFSVSIIYPFNYCLLFAFIIVTVYIVAAVFVNKLLNWYLET